MKLAKSAYSFSEADPYGDVSVVRQGGWDGMATVMYRTLNGTAVAGSDFTETTGTLTFTDLLTTQTVYIPLLNDTDAETRETFTFEIYDAAGVDGLESPTTATVSIGDHEAGTFCFSAPSIEIGEENASVVVTVLRTGGSVGTATVDYFTASQTAWADEDYPRHPLGPHMGLPELTAPAAAMGSRTVTVFGSASPREGEEAYEEARRLGMRLAAAGFTLCNGGYGGTMEAAARGA